jgi:hypothetical protein
MGGSTEKMQVNAVWRFYLDQDRKWRWQRLTVQRVVISESNAAYLVYEQCVADAQKRGYTSQTSQFKQIQH